MLNKRAQMEILGLAIIMVIVMIGVLLALQFFFLKVPKDPTQAARDKQLGANLLDSMLETTSNCRNVRLLTLLQDCAKGGGVVCRQDLRMMPEFPPLGGGSSCNHAHATIDFILNQTLETWGRKYMLEIKGSGFVAEEFSNTDCDEFEAIERVHPTGGVPLTITLRLCR